MFTAVRARLRNRDLAEMGRLALVNAAHMVRSLRPSALAEKRAGLAFDKRWGTETSAGVSVRELGFDARQIAECRRYDPSDEEMLRAPVAALGIDPAGYDFVDYGAGKGRAMMLALELRFGSVAGIELSERLCDIARANIARFVERGGAASGGEVLCADATTFAPRGRHILAYFYNPFGATIMAQVRARLEQALHDGAESVIVVYANPEHERVFADAPGWRSGPSMPGVATFRIG